MKNGDIRTLRVDTTQAALVAGRSLVFGAHDFDAPGAAVPAILRVEAALKKLNKKLNKKTKNSSYSLFFSGDTSTDMIGGGVVIGRPLVMTSCWAPKPVEFDPTSFLSRMDAFPRLDEGTLRELDGINALGIESVGQEQVYLVSWGSLCSAAVYVGKRLSQSERHAAVYEYWANQNGDQLACENGVDGMRLKQVSFWETESFRHDEESINAYKNKVSEFSDATFFLSCGYDEILRS